MTHNIIEDEIVVLGRLTTGTKHPRSILKQDMTLVPIVVLNLDTICLDPSPRPFTCLVDCYMGIFRMAGQVVRRCQACYSSSKDSNLAWFCLVGAGGGKQLFPALISDA